MQELALHRVAFFLGCRPDYGGILLREGALASGGPGLEDLGMQALELPGYDNVPGGDPGFRLGLRHRPPDGRFGGGDVDDAAVLEAG